MLFSHIDTIEPIDKKSLVNELPLGSLFINFWSKIIYTKTLNSEIIPVGNSKRELTQFSIYEPGFDSKVTTSILQFTNIDGVLKLTTKYPFFYIYQFKNTNINIHSLQLYPYLGFTDGKLVNKEEPKFRLQDLYEVSNLTLDDSFDNYVLTINANSSLGNNFNKNPFVSRVYYFWELKPESTRIPVFDDVSSPRTLLDNTDVYKIIRTTKAIEGFNKPYRIDELNTAYDINPKLSNNLDCKGKAIYGQTYHTQTITLTEPKTTISCNCDLYKSFIIIGSSNTLFIEFSFNLNQPSNSEVYVPITLILKNFSGGIGFDKNVEFENGIAPRLSGTEHTLNVLLTISTNKYKMKVIQKSTNLRKTI